MKENEEEEFKKFYTKNENAKIKDFDNNIEKTKKKNESNRLLKINNLDNLLNNTEGTEPLKTEKLLTISEKKDEEEKEKENISKLKDNKINNLVKKTQFFPMWGKVPSGK